MLHTTRKKNTHLLRNSQTPRLSETNLNPCFIRLEVGTSAHYLLHFFSLLFSSCFFCYIFVSLFFCSIFLGQIGEEKCRPKDPTSMHPSRELPSCETLSSPSPASIGVGRGWHAWGTDLFDLWPTMSYAAPTIGSLPPSNPSGCYLIVELQVCKI